MELITINVNKTVEGQNYSINASTRNFLKIAFPNSNPANSVFVSHIVNLKFQSYIGSIEDYVFTPLLDISGDELKKKINSVVFKDVNTGEVLNTIEL